MKSVVCLLPLFISGSLLAQTTPPPQWHHLDPTTDNAIGISTDRAYELLKTAPAQPRKPVIVAVIDGGIDQNHEDLKSVLWTNAKEIAGNGKDDDRNGYVDDVHGWNFHGGRDGRNMEHEQKEETRLYARLKPLYEGKTKASLTPAQQQEYDLWTVVKPYFEQKRADVEKEYREDTKLLEEDKANLQILKKAFGVSRLDSALLHHPPTTDTTLLNLARLYYRPMAVMQNADADSLVRYFETFNTRIKERLDYAYNLQADERVIVGDNPADLTERFYGNANLITPLNGRGTFHGTHVSGIIAADRTNALGVKGVADRVQILSVRCIPDGDERDKDVANAIRYAVDNGANIINMSFGKYFSPEKAVVDEAMRYADRKGVLIVHAAGNDHLDLDSARQYPSTTYLDGQTIPNLITVGASNRSNDSTLAASFSNYGATTVDVFAPGVGIWSCDAGNKYRPSQGTSMATPVVAGIAAVLKTYFPNLSPADLKRIILQSAVVYHTQVVKPGTKQKVDFATLSTTGGIANLYEAVKRAMAESPMSTKHK
jgi:subtilisin family serine protease